MNKRTVKISLFEIESTQKFYVYLINWKKISFNDMSLIEKSILVLGAVINIMASVYGISFTSTYTNSSMQLMEVWNFLQISAIKERW